MSKEKCRVVRHVRKVCRFRLERKARIGVDPLMYLKHLDVEYQRRVCWDTGKGFAAVG